MYNTRHGIGKAAVLAVVGLTLVGVLACCGALGTSAMAFQAGQNQGYAVGVVQSSGEGVAPGPHGYYGPGMGMGGTSLFVPLLCGGGLILVLGAPILLLLLGGAAACGAGKRHRPWRGPFGPGFSGELPDDMPDDMPDDVREYVEQHCQGHHFGPWMFRRGPWGHGPWADEEVPDEVKQWFRQRFAGWPKGHPPQAAEPTAPPAEETPSEASA